MKPAKNPTASEMGKRGMAVRYANMTPEERKALARRAANRRWAAVRLLRKQEAAA